MARYTKGLNIDRYAMGVNAAVFQNLNSRLERILGVDKLMGPFDCLPENHS